MKINKETRRQAKELFRASYADGKLERKRVSSLVKSLIEKKPRHYIQILEAYQRLIRLDVEKRTATVETATELPSDAQQQIVENLKRKYGGDLAARFVVSPELLGGMRIRVGSDVWDSSVRNRLQRLQQQL